ncbi:hypothetical protein TNCV_835021 [Trichonephila clavipes]|nr:hypothetical protein TNCV_835021 [Trichonephila clavipes]
MSVVCGSEVTEFFWKNSKNEVLDGSWRSLGVAIALLRASQTCFIRMKCEGLAGQSIRRKCPHFLEIHRPHDLYVPRVVIH